MPQEPEQNKSVGWVALVHAAVVLYFGWAFLASDFFQNDPDGPARANLWVNSITQLGNFGTVIGYGFRERAWLIGLTVGDEFAVFFLFLFMKKMERELWGK